MTQLTNCLCLLFRTVHEEHLADYGIDPEIDWTVVGVQLVLQPAHLVGSEQVFIVPN